MVDEMWLLCLENARAEEGQFPMLLTFLAISSVLSFQPKREFVDREKSLDFRLR
jgi:hypothetical protein